MLIVACFIIIQFIYHRFATPEMTYLLPFEFIEVQFREMCENRIVFLIANAEINFSTLLWCKSLRLGVPSFEIKKPGRNNVHIRVLRNELNPVLVP